ncbi:Mur ligase domain-containing protein [Pseudomonas inefficax]|uniref:Mur ligase domain-containing protein n=1 Tax=Pseudomonas inefficax TaxID=2078786 RepID=UPI003D323B28
MANDQPRLHQHLAIARTIRRGVTHQRGMPAWHRVDTYPRIACDYRNHASKTLGALIPRVEAYILFDVISQRYALDLYIANSGHRVDGKDVHRYAAQHRVLRHGVSQHVATDPSPAPAH